MAQNNERQRILKEIKAYLKDKYGESKKKHGLPRSIDIHCNKDGKDTYFCVMAVSFNKKQGAYFDATVSSEWKFIKGTNGIERDVLFVIYRKDVDDKDKRIVLLTPEQVLSCSEPHLSSFQIKFKVSRDELDNPKILLGKNGLDITKLYGALDRYDKITESLKK